MVPKFDSVIVVVHHPALGDAVVDAKGPGPRHCPAGVRADQPGPEFGGHLGQPGIGAGPGVVDQVGSGRAGLLGHVRPPGIDADQLVRVFAAEPFDERHDAGDLLVGVDGAARTGLDAADVDDVGSVGDLLVGRFLGCAVAEGRPPVIEGIRGAVDDRHDQRAIAGHLAAQELAPWTGLHGSQVIGLPQIR